MAAATNVIPNMKKHTAVTMRPERTFLLARLRYMVCLGGILELEVGDHRAEEQGQVDEREQVQAQRRAPVGAAAEQPRAADEQDAEDERGDQVDRAQPPGAEGQLRHRVEQDAVE